MEAGVSHRAASMARSLLKRPADAIMAGVFAFACVHAFVSLWYPFGWDHAILASVGDAIARGGLPYRDAWDMKGPLGYLPFSVAQLLFGHGMWGVRLVDLAIQIPALFFLYRVVSAHTSRFVGVGASLALYLWLASAGWFFTAQPEVWVTMLTAIACGLVLRSESQPPATAIAIALCGGLIACAGLIKPLYLAFGLAPLAYLVAESRLPIVRRIMLAVCLAAGTLAPIVIVIGYIVARGGLDAFIEVELLYTLGSYGGAGALFNYGLRDLLLNMWAYVQQGPIAILTPFAVLGLWAWRRETRVLVVLLAWVFAALFAVAIQGRLWTYQWFPVYPPLIVCAALGVHALVTAGASAPSRVLAVAAMLFLAVQVSFAPAREVAWWARSRIGMDSDAFNSHFGYQTYTASDEIRAARHIREHTAADEGVYVWGIDATVAYLSERPNPSRFTFNMPLILDGDFRAAYRQELLADLAEAPPTYIVVGSPWLTWRTKESILAEFPEFEALLGEGYAIETSYGNVDLYRRTVAGAPD